MSIRVSLKDVTVHNFEMRDAGPIELVVASGMIAELLLLTKRNFFETYHLGHVPKDTQVCMLMVLGNVQTIEEGAIVGVGNVLLRKKTSTLER